MAIILRSEKGSPLTHNQLDQNFRELIYSSSVSGSVVTLHRYNSSGSTTPVVSVVGTGSLAQTSGSSQITPVSQFGFTVTLTETERALAETISHLEGRVKALEEFISSSYFENIQVENLSVVNSLDLWGTTNMIKIGTGSIPEPDFQGQVYISRSGASSVIYQSYGSGSGEWKQTSN